MLHFNELRITQDNKFLIVDVSVDKQDFFDDILIDSIVVDTQDTYVANGPSANPIYSINIEDVYDLTYSHPEGCECNPVKVDEDKTYCLTYGTHAMKNVRLQISMEDLGISLCNNMFFVYVIARGTPSPDTPQGFDKNKILGTVINLHSIYLNALKFLRQVECECETPKGLIDLLLKLKAIELSIRTGNHPQAIKYWKKFFLNRKCGSSINCGCHG